MSLSYIYNSVFNNRLWHYCNILVIKVDEQNGFRKEWSCIDHIFVLSSIIKNRLNSKLSTYCAFIDFRKAFNCINRDLLQFKLFSYNIDDKIFKAINVSVQWV